MRGISYPKRAERTECPTTTLPLAAHELPPSWLELAPSRPADQPGRRHRGQHRQVKPSGPSDLITVKARFIAFSTIGAAVFLLGLAIQIVLVRRWHFAALTSYLVQGFISVQISFLLNRFWTWRDVRVSFLVALVKFNIQKIVTTVANTLIFEGLVAARLNYIAANIATTAIFTIVNYLSADNWVFARHDTVGDGGADEATTAPWWSGQGTAMCPPVSVVVPCKNSERTIRATVLSLLGQDYPGLESVVLVGSTNDATWRSLTDIIDPRLVVLENKPGPGCRDPNLKRHVGIKYSASNLVAMADSDIVMDRDWLSKGVGLLLQEHAECVAGGMRSIDSTFWGRFVDSTRMGAKTPRLATSYLVTWRNFGKYGRKPPVTANVILTRRLYDACPLDIGWSFGYEDYEWFWRMAKAGHRILFTHELSGQHHHRRGLRPLCREYLQSSDGCARFINRHPDCPLAIKRRRQAYLLPLAALAALATAAAGVAAGYASLVVVVVGIAAVAAAMWEYLDHRATESLVYPVLNILLGALYVYGMLRTMTKRDKVHQVAPQLSGEVYG
jgi:glycosyltransferase involved in cell wall biosynthesis/putative flippase GtrA